MTDNVPANTSTTSTVAVNGSATGQIDEYGDVDWIRVTLQAGVTYTIGVAGADSGSGTLADPYLNGIYDANGNYIGATSNDDGGTGLDSRLEFTPSSSGTYFIAAAAYSENTGTYTVTVAGQSGPADDFGQTISTAGTVSVGGSRSGSIETSGDQDWVRVTLQAGVTYTIGVSGADSASGTLVNPYLAGIFNASGSLLAGTTDDDGGTGLNSELNFTPTANGDYYIAASAYGSGTGTYTISVGQSGPADDFGATTSTTGTVNVGGSRTGSIEAAEDQDWIRVSLEAGVTYTIGVAGADTAAGTLSDPYLTGVYDANGDLVAGTTNDDGGTGLNSLIEFTPAASGNYYIAASAYGSNTGTYTVTVTGQSGPADDYSASSATTGSVTVGSSRAGTIEVAGDRDWLRVALTGGVTYAIGLEGLDTGRGTLADTYLAGIYDANGNVISGTSDDDGGTGLNSRVEFRPSTSGNYYIAASGYGSGTGTYTVSVAGLNTGPSDDYAQSTATTGAVSPGGSRSGIIEVAGDQDWIRVSLQAGVRYTIDLRGVDSSSGSLLDPYLTGLYGPGGVLLAGTADDDGGVGLDSRIEFTPSASDTYYIAASAYGSNTGSYTVAVSGGVVADDFAQGTNTAGTLAVGGSRTGAIESAGDVDWFRVTLQSGMSYAINLEGVDTAGGTLPDPYLSGVYDAGGNLIAGSSDDDGGTGLNSRLEFAPPTAGTYYVAASGFGGSIGTYKLTLVAATVQTDDFGNTPATTGSVSAGSSRTGAIEAPADRDWIRVNLQAGVTYVIDLEGSDSSAGTLADPYLRGIYNADGSALGGTSDDDGGNGHNAQLTYSPQLSGTYYIEAAAYGSGTGSYKLSVTALNAGSGTNDDYGQDAASAGTAVVGSAKSGSIERANDSDWFAIALVAGRTYQIDLEGSSSEAGTLSDTLLRGVYSANGSLIAGTEDDDGGTGSNSQVVFTAASSGTHYISAAAYGTNTGTYRLTATDITSTGSGGTTGAFDIVVNFSGAEAYRSYFAAAAARWEQILTTDISDYRDAFVGFVDDLVIDAAVVAIDGSGGTLGRAGADVLRPGSHLPAHGIMEFDVADMAGMAAKGTLGAVILHEMGHVLGISGYFFRLLGLASGNNYTGQNALDEYRALRGNPALTFIPLEEGGGAGTAGSHWDEEIFHSELMTGYAENAPPMPLSRLTIGLLEDLGYGVNYGAAEQYSLGSQLMGLHALGLAPVPAAGAQDGADAAQALVTFSAFAGTTLAYENDKALQLAAGGAAPKLSGSVTSAGPTLVYFIESGGDRYTVRLAGTFEKNAPADASGIKGMVSSLAFYSGIVNVLTVNYETPREVQGVIDDWQRGLLAGANYIRTSSLPLADNVMLGEGNDVADLGGGNDTLNGGSGVDTSVYHGNRADYSVSRTTAVLAVNDGVADRDGSDSLSAVERLVFANEALAFDLDGNAGNVAKTLGAVFGGGAVANKTYAGIGLHYADGGMGFEQLMQLALNARLGTQASNRAVVDLLYENVVGARPTDAQALPYINMLDSGAHTHASLGVLAANTALNQTHVNLVGLADSGLAYMEYAG